MTSKQSTKSIITIFIFIFIFVPSTGWAFSLFGKVKTEQIKLDVVNYLDTNITKNTWDITIVTPKRIRKNKETQILVFYRIQEDDYRSYLDVIYDGSVYNIQSFNTEINDSRHLAVPRKKSSIWLDVENRFYPFRGMDNLEFKCQLADKDYYKPTKPNDEVVLDNSHIEKAEPYKLGGELWVNLYLTPEGLEILNDIAKNNYNQMFGLKIGFVNYTKQHIEKGYNYKTLMIPTGYNLDETELVIQALIKNRNERL